MLTEFRDVLGKVNKERVAIGYDLNAQFAQISYCNIGSDVPETLSTVAGEEEYNIPVVLCKKRITKQWLFGKDAIKCAKEGEGDLVTGIFEEARKNGLINVEGEEYQAQDLLALFVKRSFSLLPIMTTPERVGAVVITVRKADAGMIDILAKTITVLKMKPEKVSFISYEESFFYYMLYQQPELQKHKILVCDCGEGQLWTYRMERNFFTKPAVATVEAEEHRDFVIDAKDELGDVTNLEKDRRFLEIVSGLCEGKIFSGVYLIGEGFYGDWCKESVKYLCKNRHVFKGNNLFSKGACYAAKEKIDPPDVENDMIFLGRDKLKANIGMKIYRGGKPEYIPLLDAGAHWYEAKKEIDLILEETDTLPLIVTPVNKRGEATANFVLSGYPKREGQLGRIRLTMKMLSESKVFLQVKDMGFGEIFPSSGMEWVEELELS